MKNSSTTWQTTFINGTVHRHSKDIPKEYEGLANGHMASHQLLINDFMTAVYEREDPFVNAVRSARYTVPGLIAHKSAMMGSVTLKVPFIQ